MFLKILILLQILIFSFSAFSNVEWGLQITTPDFEVVPKKLSKVSYKPFMAKTGWRCTIEEEMIKNNIYHRKIYCNFSVKSTGAISTSISCSKERKYDEVILDLHDDRKSLDFKFMVTCRHN